MTIKIHGVGQSTCTQRVVTVLNELNVPYEIVAITDFSSIKKPEHLKLQPFGKIPVLEDDGFFLYESRAMAKYIANKYASQGPKLIPDVKDSKAYGLFEQACSIEYSYFDPVASGIAAQKVFIPMHGGKTDEAALEQHAKNLDAHLAVYETILSKQKYLAGDEITLADLFHLPYGALDKKLGYEATFDKYPHVAKWFNGLQTRESWQKASAAGKQE